ncbi:Tumor necrosis factor soluble receptor [Gossypium arboreum]|uniref:Tumor necrosis factor soluble receptor n=1 Tax=Gossypium arboreum TaxID=29729 RepID=A0A0B0NW13_GOSAR|nr:Tumor necrosis factor soluble receptor [Gossypium arboreum]
MHNIWLNIPYKYTNIYISIMYNLHPISNNQLTLFPNRKSTINTWSFSSFYTFNHNLSLPVGPFRIE